MNKRVEEYGRWLSPITALMTAQGTKSSRNTDILIVNDSIYWTEPRPEEKGRIALMKYNKGNLEEVIPSDFDVRTKVHEYGGAPFTVYENTLYFIHSKDQRLYAQHMGQKPVPLTQGNIRLADFQGCPYGVIAIAEEHSDNKVANFLALIDTSSGKISPLDSGADFYASPALSPDGKKLAWLTWNHPNMPWDGTELWIGDLSNGHLENKQKVAGGLSESIFQPQWSPNGTLYFVSDRSNWWNIYRWKKGSSENVCPMEAEFGLPQWRFGLSSYGFTDSNETLLCTYQESGMSRLALLDPETRTLKDIPLNFSDYSQIRTGRGFAVMLMGSVMEPRRVIQLDLDTFKTSPIDTPPAQDKDGNFSSGLGVDRDYFTVPEMIEFPTFDNKTAYGYFYAPKNKLYTRYITKKPPLIVFSHGGPTASADTVFNLRIQYWTSRGFAVLDVNYGGSTGFGRSYRERLKGQWGIVDVKDCEYGALYLVHSEKVDVRKLFIRGTSAGGYTTLAALAFTSTFSGGASFYGIGDLMALVQDTHKFEARYLDALVGPLPESEKLYYDRSPLFHAENISCPVIFFQGADDKIVPKSQAETMYRMLKDKGIKTKLIIYDNEEHGFRQSEHIEDSMREELEFYLSLICSHKI